MRFNTTDDVANNEHLFIVTIGDKEWLSKDYKEIKRFQDIILSRLANIIVGWIFKHHKDDLIDPIMENVIEKVSREVSRDILSRLGLPLESDYEPRPPDKIS